MFERYIVEETAYDAVTVMSGESMIWRWGESNRPINLASVRKSVISLLFGIAAEKGMINLDATLADLGIDDAPQPLTDMEKTARVRDLLASRSGIYLETLGEPEYWRSKRPPRGSQLPGSFWFYNNWDFNALGTIFERATGKTIGDAIYEWLAEPLEMSTFCPDHVTYEWADHTEHPMWRVYFSAEDLARVGVLVLQEGRYKGRQLVPAAWIRESTSTLSDSTQLMGTERICDGFGLLWWTRSEDGTIWGQGSGGQFLIVDRSNNLVTVVRNNTGNSVAGYLWAQTAEKSELERASEDRAAAFHQEVVSCR